MLDALEEFYTRYNFKGRGPLSVALVLTDKVKHLPFPLDAQDFLTPNGGQVKYLGGDAIQTILKRHQLQRILASEGGRTSRGSIANMNEYIQFLNAQQVLNAAIDWDVVELFWIEKVKSFFNAMPFKLSIDSANSVTATVRNLLKQAVKRQQEQPGVMLLGTMMQHLVGAKLTLIGTPGLIHHNANQNDQRPDRTGDFDIGDTSIHVTTSPTERLLEKCRQNLSNNQKPLIITLGKGVATAEGLAENIGLAHRVDIIDFEQFITGNIHERGEFSQVTRQLRLRELIDHYNVIIEQVEPDHSLKISLTA